MQRIIILNPLNTTFTSQMLSSFWHLSSQLVYQGNKLKRASNQINEKEKKQ